MSTATDTTGDESEPVGAVLARMRRARRLTGAQLGDLVGMSQPKISRIERGQSLSDPADIGAIARALGADEEQARALMDRAQQAHDRMTDWRPASADLADQQKALGELESVATVTRELQPTLVPGLLQTSGYAKAVLQSFQRIQLIGSDVSESMLLATVSARVRRQVILADRSRTFRFVIGEAALKRRTYPVAEMLAQINHLREIATRNTNVRIAVIPDEASSEIALMHGFELLDDKVVLIDLFNRGLISRNRRDTDDYRRVFDTLEDSATDVTPVLDKYQDLYIEMLRKPRR
jgi:transcriptional regulator with XRE-family HTH domain